MPWLPPGATTKPGVSLVRKSVSDPGGQVRSSELQGVRGAPRRPHRFEAYGRRASTDALCRPKEAPPGAAEKGHGVGPFGGEDDVCITVRVHVGDEE